MTPRLTGHDEPPGLIGRRHSQGAPRLGAQQSLAACRRDPALDLLIHTIIAQLEFFEKHLTELDIQGLFSTMEHPIKTQCVLRPYCRKCLVPCGKDLTIRHQ